LRYKLLLEINKQFGRRTPIHAAQKKHSVADNQFVRRRLGHWVKW